jgi:TRAP-type transport system small permease protein
MREPGTVARLYYGTIEIVAIVVFCAMLFCMVVEVFFRYVLQFPLTWIEELSQFLLIWSIFWGAIPAHRRGLHPSVDFLVVALPDPLQRITRAVAQAAILLVLFVLLIYGVRMMESLRAVRSAALNLPWVYINAVVPLSAALMVPHQIRLMVEPLRRERGKATPAAEGRC